MDLNDIKKMFPDDANFWDAVANTFDMVIIAEEEIENAKNWVNADKQKLHDAFKYLTPQYGINTKLYRAHCYEILSRVQNNKDLAPATDAELCWLLHVLGQHQPLTEEQQQLYMMIFSRIMSSEAKNLNIFPDYEPLLLYEEMREKFSIKDRTPK